MISQPCACQPLDRVEDGLVLGDGRHEVVAPPRCGPRDPLDGQVIRFGRPGREHDLPGLGSDGPATCSRACSTASAASQPKRWETLAELP